jgi:hypothetical protein
VELIKSNIKQNKYLHDIEDEIRANIVSLRKILIELAVGGFKNENKFKNTRKKLMIENQKLDILILNNFIVTDENTIGEKKP